MMLPSQLQDTTQSIFEEDSDSLKRELAEFEEHSPAACMKVGTMYDYNLKEVKSHIGTGKIEDIDWSVVPFAEDTKEFRSLKEMLEDIPKTTEGILTTFRMIGAIIQWILMVFNVFYVFWKWLRSPARDPSKHFNLSQLIIVWFELLICNGGVCGCLIFTLCGLIELSNGLKSLKFTSLFNTFQAIQIFNASNTLSLLKDAVPDFLDRTRFNWEDAYKEHEKKEREQGKTVSKLYNLIHKLRMNITDLKTLYGNAFVWTATFCVIAFLFYLSIMSLAVKIADLKFVGHKELKDWSAANFLDFFGLFFQISSIATHDPVQIQTAYNCMFWNDKADYKTTQLQSQKLFQNTIPKILIETFGYIHGLMILVTLNEKDLYLIWNKGVNKVRSSNETLPDPEAGENMV